MSDKSNIATALAAAQSEMGKAKKNTTNPHFHADYADLASVISACLPSLNAHGIAVTQPVTRDEIGLCVKTVFTHGESGEVLECQVPLIIGKNDMQGFGSAVTYARRYGLMCMAGISPEDDDGNAAAKSAPETVSTKQFVMLRDLAAEANVDPAKICEAYGASSLEQFPVKKFEHAINRLRVTIAKKPPVEKTDIDDEIPY